MLTLTVLHSLPPFAIGLARDLRVRWALEEAGLPYRVRTVDQAGQQSADYRREQPFGQIPVLQDDGIAIFESGAILLYLGERHPALLPVQARVQARMEATMWMFAALNSVEPHVARLGELLAFHAGEAWAQACRPGLEAMAARRLGEVDAWLAGTDGVDRAYLAGEFSAADILMTTVLRMLDRTGMVDGYPRLAAYKERCIARPAFGRALADHAGQYTKEVADAAI
jgi:glutathione S-transferase